MDAIEKNILWENANFEAYNLNKTHRHLHRRSPSSLSPMHNVVTLLFDISEYRAKVSVICKYFMENFFPYTEIEIKYAMRNQIMKIFACLLIPTRQLFVLYIDVIFAQGGWLPRIIYIDRRLNIQRRFKLDQGEIEFVKMKKTNCMFLWNIA